MTDPDLSTPEESSQPVNLSERLGELAIVFFRLGATAFGGPAAHIAMMDDEVVKRRQWLDRERLLDLMGATSLIPGPNSTELAIHIGYERAGWPGLFVAGSCFIVPAMAIVWILAVLYQKYQTLPEVGWLLYGIKPVIIAIIGLALVKLGQKAVKGVTTGILAVLVIVAFVFGINEILLLVVAGLAAMLILNRPFWGTPDSESNIAWIPWLGLLATMATPVSSPTWSRVFWIFLKIGSVLYGSGYVLLAFLEKELVERMGWLSSDQLLDAVAIGQFTPGPVFTTATFIGYLLAGNAGAVAATIGIFLPAFMLVGLVNPFVNRLRDSKWTSSFLDGVNAASLALMAVVAWRLMFDALVDPYTLIIGAVSLLLVWRYSINSAWLVLGGGILGWVIKGI